MHPASPRPVRVIVEIDPGQVSSLVTQLLDRLCARAPQPTPEGDGDTDDAHADDGTAIESTADPPATPLPTGETVHHETPVPYQQPATPPASPEAETSRPVLPQALARSLYLGPPCHKGHTYEGSAYSLRKKSNRGCVQCDQERQHRATASARQARKAQATRTRRRQARQTRQHRRVAIAATLLPEGAVAANGHRPELPTHLEERCFLSPVTCVNAQHRYRGTGYTLRYLDSETCVQCGMGAGEEGERVR